MPYHYGNEKKKKKKKKNKRPMGRKRK